MSVTITLAAISSAAIFAFSLAVLPMKDLSFNLDVERSSISLNETVMIVISLANQNDSPMKLTGCPFMVLAAADGPSWWAPFDFDSLDSLGPNQKSILLVPPHQTIRIRLDLTGILWAEIPSSVWPSHNFRSTIKPGSYTVQLRIDTREDTFCSKEVGLILE